MANTIIEIIARPQTAMIGGVVQLEARTDPAVLPAGAVLAWTTTAGILEDGPDQTKKTLLTTGMAPALVTISAELTVGTETDTESVTVTLVPPSIVIESVRPDPISEGGVVNLEADAAILGANLKDQGITVRWDSGGQGLLTPDSANPLKAKFDTTGLRQSVYPIRVELLDRSGKVLRWDEDDVFDVEDITVNPRPVSGGETLPVTLRRAGNVFTRDLALWIVIRNSTEAMSFDNYSDFMDIVLCGTGVTDGGAALRKSSGIDALQLKRALPYNDADAYRLLKIATEAFLMTACGVAGAAIQDFDFSKIDLTDVFSRVGVDGQSLNSGAVRQQWLRYLQQVNGSDDRTLPYLAAVREQLSDQGRLKSSIFFAENTANEPQECFGLLRSKLINPCLLELIWSYWHEEGMLVQTLNALSLRFQNVRARGVGRDPLEALEIDPLRPLNNLLWGYIQDEQHRLSVMRRVYEYDHHYGLRLHGRAVKSVRSIDPRSKFLEAFHNILYLCSIFFKEDDDTTVIADAFPVLNALKEVHLLLAEGAHNQFGDLPSTARQEMLIQQWLLARPEFREFLPSRVMVAYPEPWMSRVDAMKNLQSWTDVSVLHFRNLGVFGERILLSIRFGDWNDVNDPVQAGNWARFWRAEIQGYIHAYRAATGVDLTTEVADSRQSALRSAQPALLLQQRLMAQRQRLQMARSM